MSELVARFAGGARCVAVVGPSGSGKSSVVRAGLAPALRAGAVQGSSDWFATTMVPGANPFESLETALLRVAVNPPPSLLEQLRDGGRGIVRSIRRCLGTDDDQVLVVIDQFEEIFTSSSPEDADGFLEALSVAVDEPSSPLKLVITLRADYYDRPLEHPTFARIIKDATVEVTPLSAEELERAITEPARSVGVEYEAGLVTRIAAETIGQPSPLPLLQYTLSELFDRRDGADLTVTAYEEIGGLTGALAARAEALYEEAGESERKAIRRIFGRMTNPGEESSDLRRRVPLKDLGNDPAAEWVLERFGVARLVTFDRDTQTRRPTVEVAHEALLREWPKLANWLEEDRDLLRSTDQVATAATTWDQGGREPSDLYRGGRLQDATELAIASPERLRPIDSQFIDASRAASEAELATEQRRVRRLRRLVAGVGAALIIALIAGGLALRQQQLADDEAELARQAADEARAQTELAELATLISRSGEVSADEPTVSILLALEAHRRAPSPDTERAVLAAMSGSTLGTRVATFERFPVTSEPGSLGWLSADGMSLSASSEGRMFRQSLESGEVVDVGDLPAPDTAWIGDQSADRRFAYTLDLSRFWFGSYDGQWEVELAPEGPMQLIGDQGRGGQVSTLAANRLVFATIDGTYIGDGVFEVRGEHLQKIVLLDATTGEEVGPGIEGLSRPRAVMSADGELIAVRSQAPGAPGAPGVIFVIDAEAGAELQRIEIPGDSNDANDGGASIVFDTEAGELVAGIGMGRLITIDLSTGEIVADIETTATSEIVDVDLRLDGRVVVVSNGLAELVDRRRGPILDSGIELRDAAQGVMRSDDTLLVTTSDLRMDVHDFGGAALAEQAVDIESGTDVALGFGNEALLDRRGNFEHLDLITGERSAEDFVTPTGEAFFPLALDADGVLAFSFETLDVARWVDGEIVERFDAVSEDVIPVSSNNAPDGAGGVAVRPDGTFEVTNFDARLGHLGIVTTVIEPDDTCTAYPAPEDGLHIMTCVGLLKIYDSKGSLVDEVDTGLINSSLAVGDATTGKLAFGGPDGRSTVVIIDPAGGSMHIVPDVTQVANLTFAGDGALLAMLELDGTLRLWDVERQEFVGALWDGTGARNEEPLWYDESTDSIWVSSSGQLLRLPLNPQRWVERACKLVGRDFTQDEWDQFVPGDDELQSACPP